MSVRVTDGWQMITRHLSSHGGSFKPDVKQVAMAYFGVQYLRESIPNGVDKALTTIVTALGNDNGPGHWDRARYVDKAGFTNIISLC